MGGYQLLKWMYTSVIPQKSYKNESCIKECNWKIWMNNWNNKFKTENTISICVNKNRSKYKKTAINFKKKITHLI